MNIMDTRKNHRLVEMSAMLKTSCRRLPLMIFAFLLLPLCACITEKPDSVIKNESDKDAVSEEKSFLASNDALLPVSEETAEGVDAIKIAAPTGGRADIACPSMNFHKFINVFREDEAVQRRFTRLPLKKMQFDYKKPSDTKIVTWISEEKDVSFPVIPHKTEWSEKDMSIALFSTDFSDVSSDLLPLMLEMRGPDYDVNHQEMVAIKSDKWQIFYNFEKTDTCWYLVSVDDKTLISEEGDIVPNWLDLLFFQRPASCLPLTFYYDNSNKRSNTGILEKLGYVSDEMEPGTYAINEKFYGLDAVKFIIPITDFGYFVEVSADAETLSDAIFSKTGKRLQITSNPYFEDEFGVAYIFKNPTDKDKSKSVFICPTIF